MRLFGLLSGLDRADVLALVAVGEPSTRCRPPRRPISTSGKTVELIISTGAGGGLDTNGRIVARHLGNHIPGNPTIVAKNMPGAGHIRAANYVFKQAPKDGTTIATFIPIFVMAQVLERSKEHPVQSGGIQLARFDLVQQFHHLCLAHHRREDAGRRHAARGADGRHRRRLLQRDLSDRHQQRARHQVQDRHGLHLAPPRSRSRWSAARCRAAPATTSTVSLSEHAEWLKDRQDQSARPGWP